jgi:hypothetical protein
VAVTHRQNVEILYLGVTPESIPKNLQSAREGILKFFLHGYPKTDLLYRGYQLFNQKKNQNEA